MPLVFAFPFKRGILSLLRSNHTLCLNVDPLSSGEIFFWKIVLTPICQLFAIVTHFWHFFCRFSSPFTTTAVTATHFGDFSDNQPHHPISLPDMLCPKKCFHKGSAMRLPSLRWTPPCIAVCGTWLASLCWHHIHFSFLIDRNMCSCTNNPYLHWIACCLYLLYYSWLLLVLLMFLRVFLPTTSHLPSLQRNLWF
jgi:hypothetical protein